jgi:uncharacterized protein
MRTNFISDRQQQDEIINKCDFCSMAMVGPDREPYVLHFNFGYQDDTIYLHGDSKGRKIDILKANSRVCLFFSADHLLYHQSEKVACSFSMKYRSVLIYGNAKFIEGKEDKIKALNIIMKQYTGRDDFSYSNPAVENVAVWKVKIETITGKSFGYPVNP